MSAGPAPPNRRTLLLLAAGFVVLAFLVPRPGALSASAWQLASLFIVTILGLMLEPIPGGAVVLSSVTIAALLGILPLKTALAGYADPTVWLVLAAYFISRALIQTGIARRIALGFVQRFGRSSLGVCYALGFSDACLASIVPSVAARSGGVILPIACAISELYGSTPGATARRLGSFLILGVYQSVCIGAAMFLTGQASNPLVADAARSAGVEMNYARWLLAGSVPGLCSLLVVPWLVHRLYPPEVTHTPEAESFARAKLAEMGPMRTPQWIVAGVFAMVCAGWMTSGWTKLDITLIALAGGVALLLSGVLSWEDIKTEKAAWDIFLWYGGLYMLGKALNETGATRELANFAAAQFAGAPWPWVFAGLLLFYFYIHYGFASITAHVVAMFGAFLTVLLQQGAPAGLVAFAFGTFVNLAAGLTHYGTTPGPMFYAHGYVPMRTWWRVGFLISLVNLSIWSTVGFVWWKWIGIW